MVAPCDLEVGGGRMVRESRIGREWFDFCRWGGPGIRGMEVFILADSVAGDRAISCSWHLSGLVC